MLRYTVLPVSGRATIHDVAHAAGVSTTTVSNALSGAGRVSETTRAKVVDVARGLGYTVNVGAANLRRRRTGALGLYLPEEYLGYEYYMHLAMGAATAALEHGVALTLVPSAAFDGGPPPHVDGMVVSDPTAGDPMLARLARLGVPLVTCERDLSPGAAHAGRVESDHIGAIQELLDHLAGQGAGRIAFLCPGPETAFGHDIREGYLAWCCARRLEPVLRDIPFTVSPEDMRTAVEAVLAEPGQPDALVSVPVDGAVGALQEVLAEGRQVPADLLVASYVDSSSLRGLGVPITAVDLAPRDMGRRAVRLLARVLAGEAPPGTVEQQPVTLQVRASTTR